MTGTIAYFRNGLGNLIQMTPALQALASLEECGAVDVCLDSLWEDTRQPAVEDLLRTMPFVGAVVNYPKEKLDTARYKRWFYTPHSEPSQAYHVFENMAKRLISRVGWDRLYMREVDFYMEAARRCGYNGPQPALYCPTGAEWPGLGAPRPLIGLCNGSFGAMAKVKQWPHFAALAAAVQRYTSGSIVCVGNARELPDIQGAVNLAGTLRILEMAAVIKALDLLITVDTGLMHVADALRVPSITLWGGTLVSKNGPTDQRTAVLRSRIPCQPCQYTAKFQTCKDAQCLTALTVGEVMHAVRERLC